jgi:hypothetical protein
MLRLGTRLASIQPGRGSKRIRFQPEKENQNGKIDTTTRQGKTDNANPGHAISAIGIRANTAKKIDPRGGGVNAII